jgi:hypothetical protein
MLKELFKYETYLSFFIIAIVCLSSIAIELAKLFNYGYW